MHRTSISALLLAGVFCLALPTACTDASDSPTNTDSGATDSADDAASGNTSSPAASALPDRKLLMDPSAPEMNETAPDVFRVNFTTTKGEFIVEVTREWAPLGADRIYNLTKAGYFDGIKFFRVMPGFMTQFGIHGDPEISRYWATNNLKDDPVIKSNLPGFMTYAKTGAPNSRSTQLFINTADNARLDATGFAPFGRVVDGMGVVNSLYSKYGGTPSNYQREITREGNAFLNAKFPELDSIVTARLVN